MAREFLSQPSIAVVGISSSKETVANGVYKKLKNGKRKVFAVGKNSAVFDGDPCYPDLASLPEAVGGVFMSVRKENTERTVDECIALKIPRVWMHHMGGVINPSGGNAGSGSGISSSAIQKCLAHHIEVIPGGCPMMFVDNADVGHKCIRWFLAWTGKM